MEREALLADPEQMMADFHRQYSGGERKQLPELERLPTNFYEDGIESLTHTLRLRQHLAMEHWTGNHDVTMFDLIRAGCQPAGRRPGRMSHPNPGSPPASTGTSDLKCRYVISSSAGPVTPV